MSEASSTDKRTLVSSAGSYATAEKPERLSSNISEVETARTSQTARTSVQSQPIWRVGVTNLLRRSKDALRTDVKSNGPRARQLSTSTSNPSPTDPSYDPQKRTLREIGAPLKKASTRSTTRSSPTNPAHNSDAGSFSRVADMEFPPIAVTGPDEPQSFFDADSSSDDEAVIHRASSVRVSKPQIIQHHNGSKGHTPLIQSERLAPSSLGPSLIKASKILGQPLKNLYDLTPAAEATESEVSIGGPADALRALEANATETASTFALPPTPPSKSASSFQDSLKESVIEVADAPTRAEALDTLPTPMGGFGSLRVSSNTDRTVQGSLDGLRSNPMTDSEKIQLARTISAPIFPNRHPHRRVTIRPSDLITTNHPIHNQHHYYREAIVSTPYPTSTTNEENSLPRNTIVSTSDHTRKEPKDRFPSPSREEVLFLTLSLARHPSASTTLEIQIPSPHAQLTVPRSKAFDDEAVFDIIRKGYTTCLLGRVRSLLSSRTLSHATLADCSSHSEHHSATIFSFNATDFLAHLHNPRLGRRRKYWLLWLRSQHYSKSLPPRPFVVGGSGGGRGSIASPNTAITTHSYNSVGQWSRPQQQHQQDSTSPAPIPSQTSAYPLTPTLTNHRAYHQHPPPRSVPSSTTTTSSSSSSSNRSTPHITLAYTFSFPKIAFALLLTVLCSVLATVLWVVSFGSAAGLGQKQHDRFRVTEFGSVQGDNQQRVVLTGLVLGVLVLLLGGLVDLAWVLGGWILL